MNTPPDTQDHPLCFTKQRPKYHTPDANPYLNTSFQSLSLHSTQESYYFSQPFDPPLSTPKREHYDEIPSSSRHYEFATKKRKYSDFMNSPEFQSTPYDCTKVRQKLFKSKRRRLFQDILEDLQREQRNRAVLGSIPNEDQVDLIAVLILLGISRRGNELQEILMMLDSLLQEPKLRDQLERSLQQQYWNDMEEEQMV